jgi:beta-N-acetylhexosaminidase
VRSSASGPLVGLVLLATIAAACSAGPGSRGTASSVPTSGAPASDGSEPVPSATRSTRPNEPTPPVATVASARPNVPASTSRPVEPGACVTELDVRARIALLVWPAVYADEWAEAISTVRSNDVGGVLLMSQDGLGADDVRMRLAELEAASRHGLIISTDEEGGDVQRLGDLGRLASQRRVSQEFTPAGAADLIAEHGTLVRSVGVDMVLGPVVDVEPKEGEVPLQPSRFFDGGPDVVADYAAAYLSGWERAGLLATLKHYPGHGAASGDTHITAGVTPSLDELHDFDLKPYADLVDRASAADAAVMIGHLTVPGLTDDVPATRSAAAVDHLRTELGYRDALLIADALGMAAVGIPEPEAAVLALAAGIDVVLFTRTSRTDEVISALERAVADDRVDIDDVNRSAQKVMALLGRDGHTCNGNR